MNRGGSHSVGGALTVGSLFSGIGGLELGLEWTGGFRTVWQSEIDPYCCKVLAKHWPDVPNLGDVTKIEWETVERVDLICGGFPCQPVSRAGLTLRQEDARWLWPEFVRCLRELRPPLVVVENTPGLLDGGMGDVLGDLATLGYDAEWDCIPAVSVGASHQRDRVFVLAYSASTRLEGWARVISSPRLALTKPSCRAWLPAGYLRPRSDDGLPLEVDRRRALGNAVVPQVAQFIGERLLAALPSVGGQ